MTSHSRHNKADNYPESVPWLVEQVGGPWLKSKRGPRTN